jgi:anti-anti-sigma factor
MQTTALFRVTPATPSDPAARQAAIRMLLEGVRRARQIGGFRHWQAFRVMGATDALLVVADWDSPEARKAALADGEIRERLAGVSALGLTLSPATLLSPSYDRRFTRQAGAATLLRLSRTKSAPVRIARESDFALQALAAPGAIRLCGAAAENGSLAVCRIDFDTEDGIWHFLESPLCNRWSQWAREGEEEETWAINLPRLGQHLPPSARTSRRETGRPRNALSVEFSVSEDKQSARIRLQGHVDARSSARCEKLCGILLGDGCRHLELDVSGLTSISADALGMLARTARRLKERGGQFVLIDNEERVKRVTRIKHLENSVR